MKELIMTVALNTPYPSFMPSLPLDSRATTDTPLACLFPVLLPNFIALELGMLDLPAALLPKVFTKFDLEPFSVWKCVLHSESSDNEEDCLGPLLHDLAVGLSYSKRFKSVLLGFLLQMCCDDGFDSGREYLVFSKQGAYDKAELKSDVKHCTVLLLKRTHIKTPKEHSGILPSSETIHSDEELNDDYDDEDRQNEEDED
ncbi:hypothetical protein D6D19_10720 [Aureobasidium pullulans]|uniref:Uncharacterized protein n=1 Tax=Aureobasidium pullulans TaxID=5580 RepID=A0A4S8YSG0_AURPU|nr:hypothetical protein D6D20_10531 [Aureobasidium pullulans]THW54387.1 hypothetical protein D6D19_10720 [Aureobasidium pullulans]THX63786.1 hypothetical protein D6D08_08140 [Aureobasidium pullulans]THX99303.1 hypothetical protein D6D01_10440 [Aureobasidium pullulans]TIA65292.1 hypothetical protein D6C76_09457 [Aureobasidium pullulans]